MTKGNEATLRALLVVGLSEILHQARKGVKGLRTPYLDSILLVGEYPEGVTNADICGINGRSQSASYQKLKRVISAGFITKSNKRYYLTDSGKQVYTAICTEFKPAMDEIVRILVTEAQRRIKLTRDDLGELK